MKTSHAMAGVLLALVACDADPTEPPNVAAVIERPVFAAGLERSVWPSAEDPGPPFYARIEPFQPAFLTADGWAVIPFYRDPECIRPDFNLLTFFDAPAAFGCGLTVTGFSLFESLGSPAPPKVSQARGAGAVPFWFVPVTSALAAAQDGLLTIEELAALPGLLEGHATFFHEVLHPVPAPSGAGGHVQPKLIIEARGVLEDGRDFRFHHAQVDGQVRTSRFAFR